MNTWHKVERDIRKLPLNVDVLMAFSDGTFGVGNFTTFNNEKHPEYRFLKVNSGKYDNDYEVVWPDYWMIIPKI